METLITFKELKEKTTPEIIKKMVEIAEGFEVYIPVNNINPEYSKFMFTYVDKITWQKRFYHISDAIVFSTLLHRAVEGWNEINPCKPIQILCNCISFITDEDEPASIEWGYDNEQYKPCHLTQCEMAIWDCLLNIL